MFFLVSVLVVFVLIVVVVVLEKVRRVVEESIRVRWVSRIFIFFFNLRNDFESICFYLMY